MDRANASSSFDDVTVMPLAQRQARVLAIVGDDALDPALPGFRAILGEEVRRLSGEVLWSMPVDVVVPVRARTDIAVAAPLPDGPTDDLVLVVTVSGAERCVQLLAEDVAAAIPAPALEATDPRCERNDVRYARLRPDQIPLTECLKDTVERVMPFWNEALAPALKAGKSIVVAAHGNSIRALVKYLDKISDDEIVGLNIPNGIPLVYELDNDLQPIRHYYLGDPEAAVQAAAAVASPGKS